MTSIKFYTCALAGLVASGLLLSTAHLSAASPFGNYTKDPVEKKTLKPIKPAYNQPTPYKPDPYKPVPNKAAPDLIPRDKSVRIKPVRNQPNADQIIKQLRRAPRPGARPKRRTLDEVKRSYSLRRRLHSIDIDTINFRYDSARVDVSENYKLADLATALKRMTRRRPYEVFLIEGHTDAPGSNGYNQTLSQDRAREVKRILVNRFGVPRRNIETAGYGEQFLKIKVEGPERVNRRVTVRRVTDFVERRNTYKPRYSTAKPKVKRIVPYPSKPRRRNRYYHPDEWQGPSSTYPRRRHYDNDWD